MRWMFALLAASWAGGAAAEDCGTYETQGEINACAGRNFDAADAELNGVYREVTHRLKDDAEGLGKLKSAERAWIAYRDADCAFAAMSVEGGSIYPMILLACREAATRGRIAALKGYLQCEEGDLSCPLPAE